MKKTILLSAVLMLLFSCGKNENVKNDAEVQYQELLSETQAHLGHDKLVKKLVFKNLDEIEDSKEIDLPLLSKIASNLNIKYSDIKIDQTSSVNYDSQTVFFVLTTVTHDKKAFKTNDDDEELGNYFQRKYLFVNREDGSVIAEEFDDNLGYYDNEAIQFSKSHILKDLVFLNENTPAIAFYTEASAKSRIVLYSEKKFTLITLADNEIKKVLYEYPIQLTNGDSNGSGTFQIETLETGMSFSDHKTNGYFDLIISKNFSYEEAFENDLENGIAEKSDLKIKRELEKIKYNGREYAFHRDDRHRFLE